jgi:hypothetical protein
MVTSKSNRKELSIHTLDFALLKKDFRSKKSSKVTPLKGDDEYEVFVAGSINSSPEEVVSSLHSTDTQVQNLALFNPNLPIEDATVHLTSLMNSIINNNKSKILELSLEDLEQRLSLDWEDEEDVEEARARILGLREDWDEDGGGGSLSFEDEVISYLFDCYILIRYGTKNQKKILEVKDKGTFDFFNYLERQSILEPYVFWTLDSGNFYFSRVDFLYEHNAEILAQEGSLFDHMAVEALSYNKIWKPLEEVDPGLIINIESGNLAILNTIEEFDESTTNKLIGFEFSAGMGDGFYPTICFQDKKGELQAIITFFTHMIDSEWLENKLEFDNFYLLLESCVPYKVGELPISNSAYFVDNSWLSNGPDPSLHVLEIANIPSEEYLAVEFVSVKPTEEEWEAPRTWAAGIFRGEQKRQYEILFKLFPQLGDSRG